MTVKRALIALAATAAIATVVVLTIDPAPAQADPAWTDSLQQAREESRKTSKPIMIDFTGSDWCGWCTKLKDEVFSTPQFKDWASRNVVLMEADFPRQKQLTAAVKQQNTALMRQFQIEGFPTIVFITAAGKELGRTGYVPGGPGPWIEQADAILAANKPAALKLRGTLTEGLAFAKAKGLPLLMVLANDEGAKQAEPLAKDPAFIKYANAWTAVVAVKDPQTGEQAKAMDELLAKYKLTKAPLLIAAIDPAADKLLYSTAGPVEPAKLIDELKKVVQPIPYQGAWIEDYEQATLIAAQRSRPMMLDFTGSDWCGWCIKLDDEVFSTDEFKTYAKDSLVLVKLDFPRKKQLPADLKKQNEGLLRKYRIQGFPTLIILSAEELPMGKMGYMEGGPGPFIEKLKQTTKAAT